MGRRAEAGTRQAMRAAGWLMAPAFLTLTGCVEHTDPALLLALTPESTQNRAMQVRAFETRDDAELLSASAAVLQDLGFQVEESVREVGFLRATKERSAREYGQDLTRFFVFALTTPLVFVQQPPVWMPVDLHQQIVASLVARPLNDAASRHEVRIVFYRIVWKGEGVTGREGLPPGEQRMEMIRDPVLYQQFFAKLAKAVFLEAFTL